MESVEWRKMNLFYFYGNLFTQRFWATMKNNADPGHHCFAYTDLYSHSATKYSVRYQKGQRRPPEFKYRNIMGIETQQVQVAS